MENEFTPQILKILHAIFGEASKAIFEQNQLIQYLNIKSRSASRGSKSRSSFASFYTIYTLVEDYLNKGFDINGNYDEYEGARFTDLLNKTRKMPFGNKLQNHAFNSRVNGDFKKYFPQIEYDIILRDVQTKRYWINENYLKVVENGTTLNLANAVIAIINCYIDQKQKSLKTFIDTCGQFKVISKEDDLSVSSFIESLLAPNVDARIFEIVSYAVLKYFYHEQIVYFGFNRKNLKKDNLQLYKTGRTNANDGGIDFVMRPLGRFFQVTETINVKKYFLDIDKIEHFPISFIIKSRESPEVLLQKLREGAKKQYPINAVVEKYMNCIEEIINIPIMIDRFNKAKSQGYLRLILDEIITQSKVEFYFDDDND